MLGRLYFDGVGVKRDSAEAAKSLLKAAAKGHAPRSIMIGQLYQKGLGVAQDMGAALTWLEAAAAQDIAEAQFELARDLCARRRASRRTMPRRRNG